jgi:hypothetical protein
MNASAAVVPEPPPGPLDTRTDPTAGLAAAFDDEARLLRQLGDVLRLQRTGVARDDLGQVERSVYGGACPSSGSSWGRGTLPSTSSTRSSGPR